MALGVSVVRQEAIPATRAHAHGGPTGEYSTPRERRNERILFGTLFPSPSGVMLGSQPDGAGHSPG